MIAVTQLVTLDGVRQAPGSVEEDRTDGNQLVDKSTRSP
jgi:hypothetical protein